MIQKRGLSVEGGFQDRSLRALVQRVGRQRESESFTNVHHLQEELDKACKRRALRLQLEYAKWFDSDPTGDSHPSYLLGLEPKDIRLENALWKKMQDMIGLENRELLGMEPLKVGLNRLFLGPPGVGKTTVAQSYAQIIIDLGLVSGEKIMLRNPSHLIGAYVGHSEKMTKKVLDDARGNVLIIDDAHMLYPGGKGADPKTDVFRIAVLDTIVANVSADPEDRCIILAGYEDEMGQLLNNSNPGLQRRFPKETALRFDTYSEDELCRIMDLSLDKCGLEMSKDAKAVSRQALSRMRINPKFGNAGDVENLLNQAKVRSNTRTRSASTQGIGSVQVVLEPGGIDPDWDRALRAEENRAALFEDFVGFNKIVKQFERYQLLVDGMRLHDIDPKPHIPRSFIFKAPPGTGKTTTARKVGRLYYDMSLLSTDEVLACSVTDLVGDHQGETGPKVLNALETGLGKVLFIDEAYRLADGSHFHMEAVGELVDAMTRPRYKNNMVIILAGYTAEMEFLLRTNLGLRSRFLIQVDFLRMSPHVCFQHLKHQVQKLKIDIPEVKGPGGDEKMKKVYRLFEKLGRPLCITTDDIIEVLLGMLRERKGRVDNEAEE
ncbi:P-loop containing nucleoside triphosphate hydrolase protein [Colletotrichum sublineola]|nr:P-loop containing nucleoside triphosphate hydrolase protein [Colletotrichum sublineola]